MNYFLLPVIPAKAGIQGRLRCWAPAFAGVTMWVACCCLLSTLPVSAYEAIEVRNGGTIRGLVKYPKESPPRSMFATRGDPQCPAGIPQDQLIVKQENRGIKNVLVYLHISQGKPLPNT